MSEKPTDHIVIVGAGLAGSLLACALAKRGFRVSVYERRPDPRLAGYAGGRSINLALSIRGIEALGRVGLAERVLAGAIPMRGRMLHAVDGTQTFQPYSKDPNDAINSVSRGGLNLTLIHAASEFSNVEFFFDHRCTGVDLSEPAAHFERSGAGGIAAGIVTRGDVVIATDGAFSAIRSRMQINDRFEYSQSYLAHGYKEMHIPPVTGMDGSTSYALGEANALHIWPRGGAMMIALPNTDKSFTCTLFWPFTGEHGFDGLRTREDVRTFFGKHYTDALPLMPTLEHDYFQNPTSSLVTVRCWPWQHEGKVLLLGDAAHAIVPFYGQGMNCAFEDVACLIDLVDRHGADWARIMPEFQSIRKPNADAIADMALDNFIEMRDKVGRPEFLYKKKIEQTVHRLFADRVTPQYNLVSFSTVPYAQAKQRGDELDTRLTRVIEHVPMGTRERIGDEAWEKRVSRAFLDVIDLEQRPASSHPTRHGRHELIDLSPIISSQLKVWPGDTPPTRDVLCDMKSGSNITLSTLRATVHLGSHADGPNHYGRDAQAIDSMPLTHYIGRCQVVDAPVARGSRVRLADLCQSPAAERILLRTNTFPDPTEFNEDFAAIDPDLIDHLHTLGVITVGIDTPSVDLFSSKDLPAHAAFLRHGMAILEGLILRDVKPGMYELMAAPLRLSGFDASPVRAVLASSQPEAG